MPFKIIRNDITKIKADAIVNTANPEPVIGGGTDTAVYNAAGAEKMLAERRKIGNITVGDAAYTPAFDLDAKYVIHTVGPYWRDGEHGEKELLRSCYVKSLEIAEKLGCNSIAFPLISTGVYKFPKGEALHIALSAIQEFLLTHDMEVTIAVFDKGSFELSGKLFAGIDEYIDEHYVADAIDSEYFTDKMQRRIRGYERERIAAECDRKAALDDVLSNTGEDLRTMIMRLMRERNMDPPDVYKKIFLDRKVFSAILCKKNYTPKKMTMLGLALAFELDVPTARELLAKTGYALSPSDKVDLLIEFCLNHKLYDIIDINNELDKRRLPIFKFVVS
ncbi:MAG: macro domain-containing protein [Ruminiclostridium sp.]|nr:macro domain-containing protein [Ruminiclostridium sp.]